MNIIFGLATDGNWMAILSDSTNDSIKFWKYLLILKSFIDNWMDVKCENVRFTMDNAPIHVSSKTKKAAEELGMKWLLLPAYSPSLAHAEWVFGMSKKILVSQNKTKAINFSKNYGKWWLSTHRNELIRRKELEFGCSL